MFHRFTLPAHELLITLRDVAEDAIVQVRDSGGCVCRPDIRFYPNGGIVIKFAPVPYLRQFVAVIR